MTADIAPPRDSLPGKTISRGNTGDGPTWVAAVVAVALGAVLCAGVALALRAGAPPAAQAGALAAQAAPEQAPPDAAALREAVAQNPEDMAARLVLAHHHFDRSDYDLALEQYLTVLEHRPDHVRALARAGWIAFEGGDNATAQRLVTAALDRRPQDAESLWFLAHVRLYGLDDPDGARAPLDALLARDDLSDEFRVQVQALRRHARR
jgi:cytochrome c-type biogenesis protein CcmH/NrfG